MLTLKFNNRIKLKDDQLVKNEIHDFLDFINEKIPENKNSLKDIFIQNETYFLSSVSLKISEKKYWEASITLKSSETKNNIIYEINNMFNIKYKIFLKILDLILIDNDSINEEDIQKIISFLKENFINGIYIKLKCDENNNLSIYLLKDNHICENIKTKIPKISNEKIFRVINAYNYICLFPLNLK